MEMLVVETISKIKRAYLIQGKPIKHLPVTSGISERGVQGGAARGNQIQLLPI